MQGGSTNERFTAERFLPFKKADETDGRLCDLLCYLGRRRKNTFYDGYHGNSFEYYDADEAGQWYRYAFSLPIPRRTLVLSKYVLGFLVALGGLVVSAIGNLVVLSLTNWENSLESWLIIVGFLEIGMIFLSIIIPVLFQFGVEKGRFLVVVIAVVPSLLIAMLGSLLKTSGVPMPSAEVLQAILYSSPLFTFAVFLISFRISVRICQKKEY